jgi:shikimate kinase
MEMQGKAFCFGAATIINGIALGKGAAFGIALKTEAQVVLTDEPGIFEVTITGDEGENALLSEFCVQKVLERFGLENVHGARIITRSEIPISRGLKSSSAAANSIVLATYSALGKQISDMEVINIGIEASLLAKVTLTGAFDDSCATYFGDVVITDNLTREILKQYPIEDDYEVIIHVPGTKIRKTEVNIQKLKGIRDSIKEAHDLALSGDILSAIRLNGLSYGNAMGLDVNIAHKAISAGAKTAGISGCGPATVILAESDKKEDIMAAIDLNGKIICTKTNNVKAQSI